MPESTLPGRFFERELAGEQAPSLATMQQLYALSGTLFARNLWDEMSDSQLVRVDTFTSEEPCYCTVMGALGEVMGIHAFMGRDGLGLWRKILSGDAASEAVFSGRRGVAVEFVKPGQLTPPDRKVLKALGHPLARGSSAPQFRAFRPGYYPWYTTESEAALLAECIAGVLAVSYAQEREGATDYWAAKDSLPLVRRADGADFRFGIEQITEPSPTESMPKMPALNRRRIDSVLARHFPRNKTLQADHFYAPAGVGARYQRKSFVRLAIVIDAETAYAFPPNAGPPEANTGEMLADAVLTAIETGSALPRSLQVRNREFKIVLDPLAKALGFSIKVADSLPALDFAKDQILGMMLGPGGAPF